MIGRQESSIIIYKGGCSYFANVTGHYGGGYSGVYAGDTADEAALFAIREEMRYIKSNPLGGTMHVPVEVRAVIELMRI